MDKKFDLKNIVLGLNIFMVVALCVINFFYQSNDFNYTLKCVGSACFVVQGAINFWFALKSNTEEKKFYLIMFVGLVFSMIGDVVINLNFVAGAAIFAIAHIWFVFAYCLLKKYNLQDGIIGGAIFIGSALFILLFKGLNFEPVLLKWVCLIYALIISTMLGKAVSNLIRERNVVNILLAIGAVLFFFSDLMLLLDNFMGTLSWTGNACMATYWPALLILAFSMFFKTKNNVKN